MSKPHAFPALELFVVATAGRNMTRPAYVAVLTGVAMMVLLTVDPAYEAAHHWVDAVLWACLAFFLFEWVVRLQYASKADRLWTYALSGRGLLDGFSAAAIPLALVLGANRRGCSAYSGCSRWFRGFRDCGSCAGFWCRNPARS